MILITYFGLLLGIIFFLLFLGRRKSNGSTRLLGFYVLFLAMAIAEPLFQEWTKIHIDRVVPGLLGGLYFLVGPLLLFYCRSLTRGKNTRVLFHFSIFFVYTFAVLVERFLGGARLSEWVDFGLYEFLFLHLFAYVFAAFRVMQRAALNSGSGDGMVSKMKLSWGKLLIIMTAALFGVTFVIVHVSIFFNPSLSADVAHPIQAIILAMIVLIGLLNTELSQVKELIR